MSAIGATRRPRRGEEESYFISMTDLMVGLVFVLLVLLIYYALQFRQATSELTDSHIRRTELLQQVQRKLKAQNVQVTIDPGIGVLRLPEDVLFDKGSSELTDRGRQVMAKVGAVLQTTLPCYTVSQSPQCAHTTSGLESIFVEGHTDNDQMAGARDNWNLSADRAVSTYRSLLGQTPVLNGFTNARVRPTAPQPLFGVSGYGPTRPLGPETSEAAKRLNRRIDIRFNMGTLAGS